jgi:hypothetical protein
MFGRLAADLFPIGYLRSGLLRSEDDVPAAGQSSSGWAPWGTRQRMTIMAIGGPALAVICIVLGVLTLGGHRGVVLLALGCALAVFWIVAIPVARRRGKV